MRKVTESEARAAWARLNFATSEERLGELHRAGRALREIKVNADAIDGVRVIKTRMAKLRQEMSVTEETAKLAASHLKTN